MTLDIDRCPCAYNIRGQCPECDGYTPPTTVEPDDRPTPPATAARRVRLVAAYLAVVTVVGYLVVGTYALSVVGFTLTGVALLLLLRASEVAATRYIRRHCDRALNVTSLELYRARKAHPAGRRYG